MKTKLACLCLLVMVIVSCASPMRIYHFPGHRYYSATSRATVDLLRHEPGRSHEAFAEIVYEPPRGMSRNEAERIMCNRAASLGADGLVIQVDNVYHEGVWVGTWSYQHRRTYPRHALVGIAIRYH